MSNANVEDIYQLSPLQRGMLLHTVHDGSADMYLSQHTHMIDGPLDAGALLHAWELAARDHPALRSSFHWKGDRPLQVVHRDVALPAQRHDWSDRDPSAEREEINALRARESAAGFDLGRPPLQRLHLIRLGDRRHCLIWTYHHLLLDGWSIPVLMNDVMYHYRSLTAGGPPPPATPPYRDYIAWLRRQDLQAAQDFWQDALKGLRPSRVAALRPWDPRHGTGAVDRRIVALPPAVGKGLREAAARHQVTISTLAQAVWAVVLQRWTGRSEITFGCASSGRPAELPDVDRMIGVFANTLPLRLSVPVDGDLGSWLRSIQARYAEMRRYEYSPLADIKKWAGLPGQELFESLLVLENYPVTIAPGDADAEQLSLGEHVPYDKISLPLTLTVTPQASSELQLLIHRDRFDAGFMDDILACLHAVFAAIVSADRVEVVTAAAGAAVQPLPDLPGPTLDAQGAAPATAREQEIAAVFRDILEVTEVDVTAGFFALGGDSFDAVRAVSRLDGASVAMLAAHPSVRELAAALESGSAPEGILRRLTRSAVPSHTLVCVPFGGGSAISYQPLAAALPTGLELLAVSLPGHEPGVEDGLRPFGEVAQECCDAVLETVDGPVSLYGHSTGVALAVEVTRRLEAAGRTVHRLFLAASFPFFEPGPVGRAIQRRRDSPGALLSELRELRPDLPPGEGLEFVARAASHDVVTGRRYFSEQWGRGSATPPLQAPITFIAGSGDPATTGFARRYRRWERFGPAVDLRTVPDGGHYFHQQQPTALAALIKTALVIPQAAGKR